MPKLDINLWQKRIQKCIQLQSKRREERIQAIKLYTGTFFGKPTKNEPDKSEVNFLYEYVDVLVSAIYARNPFIFARSRSSRYASFAQTMQDTINYYWVEKKLKQKIRKTIKETILQPPGWMMAGYKLIKSRTDFDREFEREFPELRDQGKTEEQLGILDETIKDDDVFAEDKSSWDVVWPDGYNNRRQAPYLIVIERTNLEEITNNPSYKSSVKSRLLSHSGPSHTIQNPTIFTMSASVNAVPNAIRSDRDLEETPKRLFHVWDRRNQQIFTLVENYMEDTIFGPEEWPYLPDGFPLFDLSFNDVPATDTESNSYPLSDVVPMLPQLKELSFVSGRMLRHGKRQGTVILAQEGDVDDTQAANIQNAGDMDLVIVDNISRIQTFKPDSVPPDWYRLRDQILQDLLRISGFEQMIASVRGIETATESENIQEGARLRQSHKIDLIEDFTVDFARYFAGLIWQFKSKEQIAEILGEEVNDDMWLPLPRLENGEIDKFRARKIIQSEIFFRIDAGSTRPPKNQAVERKQKMDLIGVLKANFPNRFKDEILLPQILKEFDFKDIDRAVIGFDEQEIAAAQQENQLLLQGQRQIVSPNENHVLHLQVHAQVTQNATLNPTPEFDEHVSEHAKFMEIQNPNLSPQSGDIKRAPSSTTPDIKRQGVPDFSDLLGAVSSTQRNTGTNTGGPNV